MSEHTVKVNFQGVNSQFLLILFMISWRKVKICIICGIAYIQLLSDGPGRKAMSNVSHTCYTCPLLVPRMKHFLQTGWLCAKLMLELHPCCLDMYSILAPISEWDPFMSTLNAAVLTSGHVMYRHQQKFLSTSLRLHP